METKAIWQSKTFWVNLLSGIVLFLEAQEVTSLISPEYFPYVLALIAGINIVLRYTTTTAVTVTGNPKEGV